VKSTNAQRLFSVRTGARNLPKNAYVYAIQTAARALRRIKEARSTAAGELLPLESLK